MFCDSGRRQTQTWRHVVFCFGYKPVVVELASRREGQIRLVNNSLQSIGFPLLVPWFGVGVGLIWENSQMGIGQLPLFSRLRSPPTCNKDDERATAFADSGQII